MRIPLQNRTASRNNEQLRNYVLEAKFKRLLTVLLNFLIKAMHSSTAIRSIFAQRCSCQIKKAACRFTDTVKLRKLSNSPNSRLKNYFEILGVKVSCKIQDQFVHKIHTNLKTHNSC